MSSRGISTYKSYDLSGLKSSLSVVAITKLCQSNISKESLIYPSRNQYNCRIERLFSPYKRTEEACGSIMASVIDTSRILDAMLAFFFYRNIFFQITKLHDTAGTLALYFYYTFETCPLAFGEHSKLQTIIQTYSCKCVKNPFDSLSLLCTWLHQRVSSSSLSCSGYPDEIPPKIASLTMIGTDHHRNFISFQCGNPAELTRNNS